MLLSSTYTATGDIKSYLQDYASAQFSAGLTATSGHIRVGKTAVAPATGLQSIDALEWSTHDTANVPTSQAIDGGSTFLLDSSLAAGSSIKRTVDSDGFFANSLASSDSTTALTPEFLVSTCPSPTANDVVPMQLLDSTVVGPLATTIDVDNPSCSVDPTDGSGDVTGVSPIVPPTTQPPAILIPDSPEPAVASSESPAPTIPVADIGLISPQLTELLPNPGAPQTDAADEFVELYNANDQGFDLSGFELATSATKKYVFPKGTVLLPHAFKAFFSGDTHLSLSNSGGQVTLYDPLGVRLDQTTTYAAAKDNIAWALANGTWQWTTRPTPNAQNAIAQPVTKTLKATTSKTSTAKTASTKTATTKKKTATKATATADMVNASDLQPNSPLHPVTLAVVGGFALLYGAYEYRRDMANKFHQLRGYRTARRETRQQPKGR